VQSATVKEDKLNEYGFQIKADGRNLLLAMHFKKKREIKMSTL
jgi:hypothetical protein